MNNQYLISVVIATKNEENNIERLLNNLLKQSLPRKFWEIIMVDDDSTDRTRHIAKKLLHYVYNLPQLINYDVRQIRNHRGAQLNFAITKTHSSLIFFPDADMTFDKRLLEEAVNIFAHDDVDCLYIPEVIIGKGFFGKIRNFERSFYNTTCIDAVRIVRKSLFLEVGGFDEKNIRWGPDDWDFTIMLKKKTQKFSITKNKIYHHEENINLRKYLIKKWQYTAVFGEYIKKWGTDNLDIKKQFGFFYRYFGVFIENGKWKKILSHPLLSLCMLIIRISIGMSYISRKLFKHTI